MGKSLESRFEQYCDALSHTLSHADRHTPARWYLQGLMLPGGRKSVEPMAARVHPEDVRSAHQSMHHLVAHSEWSDRAWLTAVREPVSEFAARAKSVWARLIGKVYEADPLVVRRILEHLGLWQPQAMERSPPVPPEAWPANASFALTYHSVPDIA